ncbi:5'-nucleotidase C-terminal domain-containing protein [Enterococcus sp. DIV0756]|uniref:5'-nucleotidase C-terminal domain-containing protein n=1 Tax=Enterococcus sp. DIV0756 TaxID=2774636 RepID=UPI003F2210F4
MNYLRNSSLIKSAITLFTVLGFTLPSGVAAVETMNSEIASTQVSSEMTNDSTSESSNGTSNQVTESDSAAEATVESSATPAKAQKSTATVPIQLLGINDFHGALSTTGTYSAAGNKVSDAGSAALLAGYFNKAESDFKAKNNEGKSLRVQAGDMVGASPANSGLLQDQPTMRILNQMNFAVGTLGNHEFDEGLGEFNRILTGAKPAADSDFLQIVKDYNEAFSQDELKGGFDLVIANVHEKDGSIPYGWQPYTIKNVGTDAEPINIGFIGVITTDVPNLVLAEHHKNYTFSDPAEEIIKYSKELVDQDVNAIVVLGHTPSVQGAGEAVSGETAEIMNKVNQADPNNSVDAFFAGHNHVYTNGVVGTTRIVQSTSQGKGYIDLQGEYDPAKKDFVTTPKATVSAVDPTKGVAKDSNIEQIVTNADKRVAPVTGEKIGTAEKPEDITRTVNELGESPVGNLVTDAQVYMANKNGVPVDFAITNNGGIRDDLKVNSDASITWGAAQVVQPFGNIMQVVEMTGQQIENVLNQQTFKFDPNDVRGSGVFLQVSGLNYTVVENSDSSDAKHQYIVKEMKKADGTPIEADKTYKLVINDFLYGGGDGFTEFTKAKLTGALDPDTETFIGYIKDLEANGEKVSAAIEGRKTLAATEPTDPAKEEAEKINSETEVDDLYEGDQYLTGKTIPNATVEVAVEETTTANVIQPVAAQAATAAPQKSGADGEFKLDVQALGLREGDQVHLMITGEKGGKGEFLVPVLGDAAAKETEQIKKMTKFANLYEGDTELTGKTIADATVNLAVEKSEKFALGKSNEKGNVILDIKDLDLKKDQKVMITVTGPSGGKVVFEKTVLGRIVASNVDTKTPSSTTWIDRSNGKVYPKTNDEKQPIFVVLGMIVLGTSGLIYFKRR